MRTDNEWRTWFRQYFLDENPWEISDESRREWIEFGWEVAAGLAFVGFVLWLCLVEHGR